MKLLPALLLAACCTCPEPEPPPSSPILVDPAPIHSSLMPYIDMSTAAFISSVQWLQSREIPLPSDMRVQEGAGAVYGMAEFIMFKPGADPMVLAHEVLHGYWEHNLVPDRANFVTSVNSALAEQQDEHAYLREGIRGIIQEIQKVYPDRLFDTELYSYIGNMLIVEADFHVPEAILRHYRTVLNQDIIARRTCTSEGNAVAGEPPRK